jgi:hypothetical protein
MQKYFVFKPQSRTFKLQEKSGFSLLIGGPFSVPCLFECRIWIFRPISIQVQRPKRAGAIQYSSPVCVVFQERTWYTPEAWEHGGLRLKEEVKDEMEEGLNPTPAKKIKREGKK